MSALVEYDRDELVYRTPGTATGHLVSCSVYPEGAEEQTFLLRAPEPRAITEELVEKAAALHQRHQGIDIHRGEWEFDWGSVERTQSGLWRPDPRAPQVPVELESMDLLFSVGEAPLGASRSHRGASEDSRWVYVATYGQEKPTSPLKRLSSMHNELARPALGSNSWGRINFPLRSSNTIFMRLTPGTPRAAVLLDTDPEAPVRAHLRVDLVMLSNWLGARLREGTDG